MTTRDEIGDLERALAELTRRLEDHLRYTESFAADFSHELKNPLCSIRSAADLLREEDDVTQQERFLDMIQRDISRVERLLSGAKEISHIDVEIEEEDRESVHIDELLTITTPVRIAMTEGVDSLNAAAAAAVACYALA